MYLCNGGGEKKVENFLNVFTQKISEMSGEETPNTLEMISEKYGISWKDFLDYESEGEWSFDIRAFKK